MEHDTDITGTDAESMKLLFRERLSGIADAFEDHYGGMVFIAPLRFVYHFFAIISSLYIYISNSYFNLLCENRCRCATNQSLIANDIGDMTSESDHPIKNKSRKRKKFLGLTYSETAKMVQKTIMKGWHPPRLKKSKILSEVVETKMFQYFPDGNMLNLPPNHFPMKTCLIVPVVVNNETAALVGLANGKFEEQDGSLIQELMAANWVNLFMDSIFRHASLLKQKILSNTLPAEIVSRMEANPKKTIADGHTNVSVFFMDFVRFTDFSLGLKPNILVTFLNKTFSLLDKLVTRHSIEKIKTIGDCYMAAGGIPIPGIGKTHNIAVIDFAFGVLEAIKNINAATDHPKAIVDKLPVAVRCGIATGPVVAGVIGIQKLQYDLWGTTVNLASRMESMAPTNSIQVSHSTYSLLKDEYEYKCRGSVVAKGIGKVKAYIVLRKL